MTFHTIAAEDLRKARPPISACWPLLDVSLRSAADEHMGFWHVGPRDGFEEIARVVGDDDWSWEHSQRRIKAVRKFLTHAYCLRSQVAQLKSYHGDIAKILLRGDVFTSHRPTTAYLVGMRAGDKLVVEYDLDNQLVGERPVQSAVFDVGYCVIGSFFMMFFSGLDL